jgi:hypothetical protein
MDLFENAAAIVMLSARISRKSRWIGAEVLIASLVAPPVGVAGNGVALTSQAHGGTVPLFCAFGYAINLNQHRVIHIARKRLVHGLDVHLQAIAGKLNAIRETACKVFDEIAAMCPARWN